MRLVTSAVAVKWMANKQRDRQMDRVNGMFLWKMIQNAENIPN